MKRYWCEWAWLGGDTARPGVTIEVQGDRIAAVTPDTTCPPDAERLEGVTLPGFANAHSHAFHRAIRGVSNTGRGSFWTWREAMYRATETLDPDSYFDLAMRTFGEMAVAGYTVVGEFHYLHHAAGGRRYRDPNAMSEAVVAAAGAAGIRITLLDALYLHGGIGPDGRYAEPEGVQSRFVDGSAEAWADRVESFDVAGDTVRIGAAIHSVRAVDPESMTVVRGWAEAADAPVHIHLSEQPDENRQSLAAHGRTPTAVVADIGLLGPRFTAVHATHLTDSDIRQIGGSGATVCLCPTTERDLADGIGPSRRLADAGAGLAHGSDSQAVIDPFEEARSVEYGQRLLTLRRGVHSPAELLAASTAGGYRSLGWDGGEIAPGRLADLVTVDLGTEVSIVDGDGLLPAVIYAAGGRHVTATMVGGRFIHRVEPSC